MEEAEITTSDSEGDTSSDNQSNEEDHSEKESSDVEELKEGEEHEEAFVGDLAALKKRITDCTFILSNWKAAKQEVLAGGEHRKDLVTRLRKDCSSYYGWGDDTTQYFLDMFKPNEAIEFFESCETPRPTTIRINTLKTKRKTLATDLASVGVTCKPLPWSKVGLEILESTTPLSSTSEYLSGHFMLQGWASMVPAIALGVQPGQVVLDMAAAPGGKSTHLGQIMKNKGVLYCNEIRKDRAKSLMANLYRMGVRNSVILNEDGVKLPTLFNRQPIMDCVLLDAPCSGSGIATKDPEIKRRRTVEEFKKCSQLQRTLLRAACDLLNAKSTTGGFLVYSTCSVAVEENEEVVNWALSRLPLKLVEFEPSSIGAPAWTSYRQKRFDPSLIKARRFFPHKDASDGFFVAKFRKYENYRPSPVLDTVEQGPRRKVAKEC